MQPTAKFPQIQLPRVLGFKIEDTATERPPHSSGNRQLTTMIGRIPFWLSAIEVLIVFVVFAAMAAVRPPDVNESHYLIKAKHFWNPEWCHNDLFLESTNAHYFFFLVAGWPTLFLSLDVYAWLGRIIVWLAASVAWIQLNRCLGIGRFISPFSAALFVLLNSRFNLAGEWVIGGFEAKSVAYVLVLWSVVFFIRGRVDRFWPALGLACAFHPLVGIWALVCFLASQTVFGAVQRRATGAEIARVLFFFPAKPMIVFFLFLLAGCLPPLLANLGESGEVVRLANQIQVHQRLAHHLLFGGFPTHCIARFALVVIIWMALTQLLPWDMAFQRMQWFVGGSLLISLAGLLLSSLAESQTVVSPYADSLLRFYWFRFSDFAVPLCLALMVGKLAHSLIRSRQPARRRVAIACGVVIAVAAGLHIEQIHRDPRAAADAASLPSYPDNEKRTRETAENWQRVCDWIRCNTPSNAVFITPLAQQTFKWYAHRAEAVSWKDAPQDAGGIVEWHRRFNTFRDIGNLLPGGFLELRDGQRREIAHSCLATHLLIPQSVEDTARQSVEFDSAGLTRIYPVDPAIRRTYVVYEIPDDLTTTKPESSANAP